MQIHSLTARSVPRQFREGLKKGMPHRCDRNIKIWHQMQQQQHPQHNRQNEMAQAVQQQQQEQEDKILVAAEHRDPDVSAFSNLHIVYDSERSDLVPYPDAEYVRTPSPEHTGIPAVRRAVRNPPQKSSEVDNYSSDESGGVGPTEQQGRKLPPSARRKARAAAAAMATS